MNSTTFGRYRLVQELGRGGMATVYQAYDPRFQRDVALKVLPPEFMHDPNFRQRFEREARTIAALEHNAIVPVYDFGEHEGQPYLVMRLMSGGTLAERLAHGPLPLDEIETILDHIGAALDKAHARNIIHRDLKPANILFDEDGSPYLSDFGIVKVTTSNTLTATGSILGTPAYMSPEQALGDAELDGRSDVYTLGVILFEMLTGEQPYRASTPFQVLMRHTTAPVPRLEEYRSDLPSQFAAVVARAMAKEREGRFGSAGALADAFIQAREGRWSDAGPPDTSIVAEAGPAPPPQEAEASGIPLRRSGPFLYVAAGCLLVVALFAVAGFLILPRALGSLTAGSATATGMATSTVQTEAAAPPVAVDATATTTGAPSATTATKTPSPAATASPTGTATPPPAATGEPTIAFLPFSVESVANAAFDFSDPPQGDVTLGEVPFQIASQIFKSQASPAPHDASPTSASLALGVPQAHRIHLLLNAGNAFLRFDGSKIGEIRARCDDASETVADLQLGRDVREWHTAANVVSEASRVQEVWQGAIADFPDQMGHIDMITFDLPPSCRDGVLDAIEIVDTSATTVGSLDPALNVMAITVEYVE